jgi:biopolymer transport protein ExbB/TolQ
VVNKEKSQGLIAVALATLGWPLLGGAVLTTGFYLLIHQGWIGNAMVRRYFAGHPVEYFEAGLFFVGLVAILMTAVDVINQFGAVNRVQLPPRGDAPDSIADAARMIDQLQTLPESLRESHLARRLTDALQHLVRKGSADNIDDELKHLSDLAMDQQHERHALVRIIIWATPMLGFLGTVIGITLALGNLSPTALVETPEAAMESLLAGLSVAFDTTALALSLSIVLMFCQFMTGRLESELLAGVDTRASAELVGRFASNSPAAPMNSRDVSANRHVDFAELADHILQATHTVLREQDQRIESALATLQSRWQSVTESTADTLHTGLSQAIRDVVLDHAAVLVRSEEDLQNRASQYWEQLQHALRNNAMVLQQQQEELAKQGDVMLQVLRATGDVVSLQDALCQNLRLLRGRQSQVESALTHHSAERGARVA